MTAINPFIFVYGTLLMNTNKHGAYLQQHCTLLKQGKVKGRLYNIGDYPGAIASDHTGEYIYGSIYLMDKPEKILPVIDAYEGIAQHEPQPWEYIRALVNVDTGDEIMSCWIYWYNWPVEGLPLIESGKYLG